MGWLATLTHKRGFEPMKEDHRKGIPGLSYKRVSLEPSGHASAAPGGVSCVTHARGRTRRACGLSGTASALGRAGMSSAPGAVRYASAPAGSCGGPEYIEINPLRRMSMPSAGQEARAPNRLRRDSMPTALKLINAAGCP